MSKTTELLTALLNGEPIDDFNPRSRMEAYLKNCCLACGCDGLPEPITETDALLFALAEKVASGGTGGSGGGVNIPLVAITYEVSGGDVSISYSTFENNEIVSKSIDAPSGSSGTLSVFPLAGIEISSKEIEDDWTGDTRYPAVRVDCDYFVGGTGHSYDVIWIPSYVVLDGNHFTITVDGTSDW